MFYSEFYVRDVDDPFVVLNSLVDAMEKRYDMSACFQQECGEFRVSVVIHSIFDRTDVNELSCAHDVRHFISDFVAHDAPELKGKFVWSTPVDMRRDHSSWMPEDRLTRMLDFKRGLEEFGVGLIPKEA